jgi:hypothetical protein
MVEPRIDECDHIRIHQERAKREEKEPPEKSFLRPTVGSTEWAMDSPKNSLMLAQPSHRRCRFLGSELASFHQRDFLFFFSIHPIDSMNDEVEGFG